MRALLAKERARNHWASQKKKPDSKEKFKGPYARAIERVISDKIWKYYKYFPETRSQQLDLAAMVISGLQGYDDPCLKEHNVHLVKSHEDIEDWLDEAHDILAKKINDKRAKVVADIKAVAEKFFSKLPKPGPGQEDNRQLPSVEDFFKVALRACGLRKGDEGRKHATLWVDEILPKATGNHGGFPKAIRRTCPVSQCRENNREDGRLLMPSTTEAFAMVVYDNHRDSWQNQFKLKEKFSGKLQHMPQSRPKMATDESMALGYTYDEKNEIIYMTGAQYRSKWTEICVGAKRDGGWKDEGREAFNEYVGKIEAARKSPRCAKWEKMMVSVFKQDSNVPPKDPETGPPPQKKARTSEEGRRDYIPLAVAAEEFGLDLEVGDDDEEEKFVDVGEEYGDFVYEEDEEEGQQEQQDVGDAPNAPDAQV
jgi:hypothetical protein